MSTSPGLGSARTTDRGDIAEIADLADTLARKITELEAAVDSARHTGAAVGIIMATQSLDETAAWALLALAGHHSPTEIAEVANHVLSTGRLVTSQRGF